MPGFLVDSFLSLADRVPTDFHSQALRGPLFLAWVLWTGEPGVGLLVLTGTQPLWEKALSCPQCP